MATAAEPRPAELPLAGGQKDAAVTLRPLLTARVIAPEAWFLREEGRLAWRHAFGLGVPKKKWVEVPVPAFLVEHPGVGPILIDTGFHPSVAVNPKKNLGRLARFTFRDLKMDPGQAVAAQLREKGIAARDVKVVVMTHLHLDHASAISEFPQATFVVSKRGVGGGDEPGPDAGLRLTPVRSRLRLPAARLRRPGRLLVLRLRALVRSLRRRQRAHRLHARPSERAHVGGPAPSDREVLVAGDAIYLRRTLEKQHLPYLMSDEHLFRRSLREIRQYRKETPNALIIPGHDWQAWQELEPGLRHAGIDPPVSVRLAEMDDEEEDAPMATEVLQSVVRSPWSLPPCRRPISRPRARRADRLGPKPALIDAPERADDHLRRARAGVRGAACGLAARGFGPGDVLAIYMPNVPEYAWPSTPSWPRRRGHDRQSALHRRGAGPPATDSSARALLTVPPFLAAARKRRPGRPAATTCWCLVRVRGHAVRRAVRAR